MISILDRFISQLINRICGKISYIPRYSISFNVESNKSFSCKLIFRYKKRRRIFFIHMQKKYDFVSMDEFHCDFDNVW